MYVQGANKTPLLLVRVKMFDKNQKKRKNNGKDFTCLKNNDIITS